MLIQRYVTLGFAFVALAACTSKYRIDTPPTVTSRLSPQASFYVIQPKDGIYGSHIYPQSGAMTARAVSSALATKATKIEVGTVNEGIDEAIAKAKIHGIQYVFEPVILNWEDRATQWSGIPDKLTLKFTVYDVERTSPVASTVVSASSKWATFGGDHPQDLLPYPTQQFVNQLF